MEDRTIIQSAASGSVRRGVRLNGLYEVGALIASGGMGEVYRGFNIVTNDPVAIKMILPELSGDPDAVAMFKREASVLLNLHHEAIVRYFVFSVDPELQRAYLAMEFVDGPSLSKRLASGPLPLDEVKVLQRRLADALETAHRMGVVHRDISSDNVILPGGDPHRAKIIDFGIARSLRVGEGTIIGSRFAGKYNYASPEQLGLAGAEVGPKSDIYSLGLVLAEAALGRAIPMDGTQAEIIEKRRKVPDLSALNPGLRPLIAAMLQPLPVDRPASMAAVASWAEAATGKPAGRGDRRESSAFGRLAALAAALIVIVSVGGALYAYRDLLPWPSSTATGPSTPPGPAPAPVQQASSEPTPSPHKLPPLPDPTSSPASPTPSPAPQSDANTPPPVSSPPGPQAQEQPAAPAPPTKPPPHVPTADELVSAMKPPKHSEPPVVVASNPPAVEPAPTAPSPPPTPKAESPVPRIEPAPAPKVEPPPKALPPRAARDQLVLAAATAGKEYAVDLPPFSDPSDPKTLALHVEPSLPEGLVLSDLGQGFGRIAGAPVAAGQYSFAIVATNSTGASARMTAQLAVAAAEAAPSPAPTISPPPGPAQDTPKPPPTEIAVAANPPVDKTEAYLRGFNGGACFLARSIGVSGSKPVILGVGADRNTFERFYAGFNREVGVEPNLTVRLIAPSQCPAVDLIGAGVKSDAPPPKIELASYDVGRGRPLAGTVSNLDGRSLVLLVVSADGQVHRIEARPTAGGASATFNTPVVADGTSKEGAQVVVAIVSAKPLAALADFKAGAASAVLPRVQSEIEAAGGALDAEFFKLAN